MLYKSVPNWEPAIVNFDNNLCLFLTLGSGSIPIQLAFVIADKLNYLDFPCDAFLGRS